RRHRDPPALRRRRALVRLPGARSAGGDRARAAHAAPHAAARGAHRRTERRLTHRARPPIEDATNRASCKLRSEPPAGILDLGLRRRLPLLLSLALLAPARSRAGSLSVSLTPYDFGVHSVAASRVSASLYLVSHGSPTIIQGFNLGPSCGEFTVTSPGGLPFYLGTGASMIVNISYDPVDRGADDCTVTIQDNNSVTDTFHLLGTGTAAQLNDPTTAPH